MRNSHKNTSRRSGLTTVEFALVLPIFMVLVMGLIEAGNAYSAWLTVQKAAQNGAHFAATGRGEEEGTRISQIRAVTEASLAGLNHGTKEVSIRSWPDLSATGDGISNDAGGPCQLAEVAVQYNYEPFVPLVASMLPETIPLCGYGRKVNEPWKPCD